MTYDKTGSIAVLTSHTPSLIWFRMDMMREFQKRGYSVYALGNEAEEKWKERFEKENITYRQICVSRNGTNPIRDIEAIVSIYKMLKMIRPDKIFTYQAKTVIYGCFAARLLGIDEVYALIAGVGSVFLSEDMKTKVLRSILVVEYRMALKYTRTVFFQNEDDLQIFKNYRMVTDRQRVVMIPGSGVNTEHFSVMAMPDTFGFLFIGRLIRDKGIYEYLEACRIVKQEFPEVRCLLVGPYDSNPSALTKEQLQPYIDEGVIEYYGEQEDVRPYIAQCSVFVLPSYREGIPKTVLEAMACGRAIITTDAPGCKYTVENGITGVIVPIKDKVSLSKAMCGLISDKRTEAMGTEGRRKVIAEFDVNIVNKILLKTMGEA